tara:strand:- start:26451 stop:27491 length:1041 start_codon:yes stop_codon:yes gene_type:complete
MKKKSLNAKKIILRHLKNNHIYKIYNNFEKILDADQSYAVALSGGPDSLALSFLAKCFSELNKTKIKFFIVDHMLRKDSSIEAKKVQILLKKHNISCKILIWKGKKPKSNIQSMARNARYSLLTNECKKLNIKTLLLGHQIDDLRENFLIRLLRGSGLKGLVSMDKQSEYKINGIEIYRPLINFEKKDLEKVSLKVFKFYVKDPSNKNMDFKRIRIRELLKKLELEGLDKKKLNLTIKNLKESNKSIEFYTRKNIEENCHYSNTNNKYILSNIFFEQSNEVVFRSLTYLLKKISSKYYPPRGKSVKGVIEKIKSNKFSKMTLGGCFIEKFNETVLISYEKQKKNDI